MQAKQQNCWLRFKLLQITSLVQSPALWSVSLPRSARELVAAIELLGGCLFSQVPVFRVPVELIPQRWRRIADGPSPDRWGCQRRCPDCRPRSTSIAHGGPPSILHRRSTSRGNYHQRIGAVERQRECLAGPAESAEQLSESAARRWARSIPTLIPCTAMSPPHGAGAQMSLLMLLSPALALVEFSSPPPMLYSRFVVLRRHC